MDAIRVARVVTGSALTSTSSAVRSLPVSSPATPGARATRAGATGRWAPISQWPPSWVGPTHHLTHTVLQGWANDVEKATGGRVKFQMLPKAPAAPPGTFDAVRDGLFVPLGQGSVDVAAMVRTLEAAGYQVQRFGQKTYNGVALLSRSGATEVVKNIPGLAEELAAYEVTKGAVKHAVDAPLPKPLVRQLIKARLGG